MTFNQFDFVAFTVLAFVFGALWGYYGGAVKWRNLYYREEDNCIALTNGLDRLRAENEKLRGLLRECAALSAQGQSNGNP